MIRPSPARTTTRAPTGPRATPGMGPRRPRTVSRRWDYPHCPCRSSSQPSKRASPGEELAAIPLPDTYRAAFVRRDEVGMFEGLASEDKDPRKSLHVGEVAVPELAPDEAYVAVMASAINFNTVWTSIFEPLPTFGFLDRLGKESALGQAARPRLPRGRLGRLRSGAADRVGRPQVEARATRSPSTATTSTTRARAPTTTRCWPTTSASGASRPTSAAWPTWRWSRPTS